MSDGSPSRDPVSPPHWEDMPEDVFQDLLQRLVKKTARAKVEYQYSDGRKNQETILEDVLDPLEDAENIIERIREEVEQLDV